MAQPLTRHSRMARLRAAAQRALHPMRRRRATELLRAMPVPSHILVICHGNVCRSPVAAAILTRKLHDAGVSVTSAGLMPYKAAVPDASVQAAGRRGIDLAGHTAQRATHAMVAEADLVVVMQVSHARAARDYFGAPRRRIVLLGDCDPEPIARRSIADPMSGTAVDFDACYARIERCALVLADSLLDPVDSSSPATTRERAAVRALERRRPAWALTFSTG